MSRANVFVLARARLERRLETRPEIVPLVEWFEFARPTLVERARLLPWPDFHEFAWKAVQESHP